MKIKFNVKLNYLIATLLLSVVGCSGNPFASQARIFNEQLNSALLHSKNCEERNASNPDVVITYEQIIVKGLNPSNRSALLASDKKLNEQQKIAFENYLKLDGICFEGVVEKIKNSPYENLIQSSEALLAVNDSNLLNGKITIGEANARKIEVTQKLISDMTLVKQQLQTQYIQEQNSYSAASQRAINDMNTATKIRQSQTTQQLLQQSQTRIPSPCIGFNCR